LKVYAKQEVWLAHLCCANVWIKKGKVSKETQGNKMKGRDIPKPSIRGWAFHRGNKPKKGRMEKISKIGGENGGVTGMRPQI